MSETAGLPSTEVATEIAEIEKLVGDHGSDYWRGSRAPELQARYRALVEARGTGAAPPPVSATSKEIAEIERTIRYEPRKYWKSPELQQRYLALIAQQNGIAVGEDDVPTWRATPDDARKRGDQALVQEWEEGGAFDVRLRTAQEAIETMMGVVGDRVLAGELERSFKVLRPQVKNAVLAELAMPRWGAISSAADTEIQRFASTPEGNALVQFWGTKARRNVAIVRARFARMVARLDAASRSQFVRWFDALTPREALAVHHALTVGHV